MWFSVVMSTSLIVVANAILQKNGSVTLKFATLCTTPNHEAGFCLDLDECNLFNAKDLTATHEAYDFIVASNCTPANAKTIKICCGSKKNFDFQIEKKQEVLESEIPSTLDPFNPLPLDCGKQKLMTFNKRIFGGIEASIGEFPWMARLIHRSKYGNRAYGCSGFLIHRKFILTAAHCANENSNIIKSLGPIFQVVLGAHNTSSPGDCLDLAQTKCSDPPQILKVGVPIVYSGYNYGGNHNNDIALIPLKSPAKFTNFVSPICLLDKKGQLDLFTLAGWGATEDRSESDVKLKVDLNRYPLNSCVETYRTINITINKRGQLCAGGQQGKDACTGDSGGPLMIENNFTWYAEGIVSFGIGCGNKGWPGVYTNIPRYIEWIKKTINRKLERKRKIKN